MSVINYSEFNTLTDCERMWAYAYLLGEEEQGARRGLKLGTLCHLWHGRWLTGLGATLPEVWEDDISTGGKPGETQQIRLSDFDSELVERATWLAGRFVECYGAQPPSSWNVIGAEKWISRDFPWGTLVGRTDGFVEIDGQLWLIEVKTYGSRPGPLAFAQVSPQLGCYSLLAEAEFGQRPFGVLYQGIYTYQWKPKVPTLTQLKGEIITEWGSHGAPYKADDLQAEAKLRQADESRWTQRPASESFEQLEVELGDAHLRTAEQYLEAALARREYLTESPRHGGVYRSKDETMGLVLPHVGQRCKNCGFKARCWSELGGVEEFEIELEDEDALPV